MALRSQTKQTRQLVLALLVVGSGLALGWFYTNHYLLTRSWVPAWSLPTAQQSAADDWVTVELLIDELTTDHHSVPLQVRYSLQSQSQTTLLLQLRSRLDLDLVDLGSDLSNLVAFETIEVAKGSGELRIDLPLQRSVLSRLPVASQLVPLATLVDSKYPSITPTEALFHQAFSGLTLFVPNYSHLCQLEDPATAIKIVDIMLPEGGQFTEKHPNAEVTVQYELTAKQIGLFTLVGGLANPLWDSLEDQWDIWHKSPHSHHLLTEGAGTVKVDLYSWFVTANNSEVSAEVIGVEGTVVPVIALVCHVHSFNGGGRPMAAQLAVEEIRFFGR